MIEWKEVNHRTAQYEIEENEYLIYLPASARALTATHDAINRYFSYETEDTQYIYPYRYVSHYAEINLPNL